MPVGLRLKINNLFRKYKVKIFIGLLIWVIIISINYYLVLNRKTVVPALIYEKHIPTLDTKEQVPDKLKGVIEAIVDEYFNYCNNKEYENAYNMLAEDYKTNMNMTFELFKVYVDMMFDGYKVYTIQNYSNLKNIYIYDLNIYEDILATGLTGKEDFLYKSEKIAIRNEDSELKLSIGGYITGEEINKTYENEHIKATVLEKVIRYDTEIYKVRVTNRTDYTVVLHDFQSADQIALDIGDTTRNYMGSLDAILVPPEGEVLITMPFYKYADDRQNFL